MRLTFCVTSLLYIINLPHYFMVLSQPLYCIKYDFFPLGRFYAREEGQLQELRGVLDHKIEDYVQRKSTLNVRGNRYLEELKERFYPFQYPQRSLAYNCAWLHYRAGDMDMEQSKKGSLTLDFGGMCDCNARPLQLDVTTDFELLIYPEAISLMDKFQSSLRGTKDDEVKGLYQVITGASSVYFVHYIPADIRDAIVGLDFKLLVPEAEALQRELQMRLRESNSFARIAVDAVLQNK